MGPSTLMVCKGASFSKGCTFRFRVFFLGCTMDFTGIAPHILTLQQDPVIRISYCDQSTNPRNDVVWFLPVILSPWYFFIKPFFFAPCQPTPNSPLRQDCISASALLRLGAHGCSWMALLFGVSGFIQKKISPKIMAEVNEFDKCDLYLHEDVGLWRIMWGSD